MLKSSPSPQAAQRNRRRGAAHVEPLSARLTRFRIAAGYSIYELATAAGVFALTIRRLESGKPGDKRVLPALATVLRVPVCLLVCGEHNCVVRACVPARLAKTLRRCTESARRPDG